jgi:hypothetical protein
MDTSYTNDKKVCGIVFIATWITKSGAILLRSIPKYLWQNNNNCKDRLYPYVDIYILQSFPQGNRTGVHFQSLAMPSQIYILFSGCFLREHNSAPKWSICAIKFEVVMVVKIKSDLQLDLLERIYFLIFYFSNINLFFSKILLFLINAKI